MNNIQSLIKKVEAAVGRGCREIMWPGHLERVRQRKMDVLRYGEAVVLKAEEIAFAWPFSAHQILNMNALDRAYFGVPSPHETE